MTTRVLDTILVNPLGKCFPSWRGSMLYSNHGTRWKIWDFLVGVAAYWLAMALSPHTDQLPAHYYMVVVGGLYGFLTLFLSQCCGIPQPERRSSNYEILVGCGLTALMTYLLFSLVVGIVLFKLHGRYVMVTAMGVSFFGLLVPRLLITHLMSVKPIPVALYGAGSANMSCLERLRESSLFTVAGYLDNDDRHHGRRANGLPVVGGLHAIKNGRLNGDPIETVIICTGQKLSKEDAAHLLRLPLQGVEVLTLGAFAERYFREIAVDYDAPHWFASTPSVPGNSSILAAKRALDVAIGGTALLLTVPLWPILMALIRLDSPGPAIFRQTRVGLKERPFTLLKFRTMRNDAEKDGARWATEADPRVTCVGRILRVTRLDELPQLINVLRGEMSLVGPRPERPEFVQELETDIPFYSQRHLVKPGLTGWAQIRYRYGSSKEDAKHKLTYELYYTRHMGLPFDLEILIKTLPMIMKGSR